MKWFNLHIRTVQESLQEAPKGVECLSMTLSASASRGNVDNLIRGVLVPFVVWVVDCMRRSISDRSCFVYALALARRSAVRSLSVRRCSIWCCIPALLATLAFTSALLVAQVPDRLTAVTDPARVHVLAHHLPAWASSANNRGPVASNLKLEHMTLVLERSSQQQAALDQLLADQHNPSSPDFHHWLTPDEMGQRFGLSDDDIATITGWLESQGLHVNWISPNRTFLGFGGIAADVNRAFQTELHGYNVDGETRYSINADPKIPAALAPAIKAIRGLSTPSEKPQYHDSVMQSQSVQATTDSGSEVHHFITPADFATIYDIPVSRTGAGETIGIVGWSRVNMDDLGNFRSLTETSFPNPTEIVPTSYGGIDPGNPCTAPSVPAGCESGTSGLAGQEEATLDVTRAGSVAPGARIELVVSTSSGTNDGIGADAQYLINTIPLVQVMSISFGDCELDGGSSEVSYWNSVFEMAAGEGISVFVSSGDSGAAGCETSFTTPSASAQTNSPNAICSSSYATCVGGTEFNETSGGYWNSSNNSSLSSAVSYIPEGGWNESSTSNVAASGGGVSIYNTPAPSWQSGTGVPTARAGRYTPDLSFSAAEQDAYLVCLSAGNGSCNVSNGNFSFDGFYGTSAAAPSMAGVAALLDQVTGSAEGNLNPEIYALASAAPSSFHDVTLASSGVPSCNLSTASICNNSILSLRGSVQQGYEVGTGYNQVTGLGSLDVALFLSNYGSFTAPMPVASTISARTTTSTSATLSGSVNPSGLDTHVWFLYGTSSNLSGASQTGSQDIGSGSSATAITVNLTGLKASTTYYFAVVAQNSSGTSYGATNSFATSALGTVSPSATTGSASLVGATTATLSGTVNPNGVDTQVWFLYGTSSTLSGATPTVSQELGTGTSASAVTTSLTGLSPSTTYYFETVAASSVGTTYGAINSFTTTSSISFSIRGTSVTLTPGTTSGNTSTITVTPANGFTGSVVLTASITSAPPSVTELPTLSFGATSPVSITSASARTATLSISTNPAAVASLTPAPRNGLPWYAKGGGALACILMIGIPVRRRRWLSLLQMVILFAVMTGSTLGCTAGSIGNTAFNSATAGTYTITITGTSGSTVETSTVTLTLN